MQPDPTTPALTALAQAAAREHTGLALGNLLHVHCAVCDLLHEFIPRDEPLAAQQPDERVAGLVEALRTIVGRWDRADIKWEPDRPHWHSIHRQGYDRLEDAINRARSLLAQPTAAGGAAGERRPEKCPTCGLTITDAHFMATGHRTAPAAPTAGGAAGERCAFVSQWGPCGETTWGMNHSHTVTCRHPAGHPEFASCHRFTPPAAPDALP
jgi:hypothetical protein